MMYREAAVDVSGLAMISRTRSALGTKARTWSTAAAEASPATPTCQCSSKASTTTAAAEASTTASRGDEQRQDPILVHARHQTGRPRHVVSIFRKNLK
jgi:hypothetical protein